MLSKFHLLCFVSMTFSHSPHVLLGEINIDIRKMKRQVQRVACSSIVVHKYIDKRIISHDNTYSECQNVTDTKHNKCNFNRLNFIEFSSREKSSCSEKLL